MMRCAQFQLLAGAEPRRLSAAQWLHRLLCSACARYLREMRRLDGRIAEALLLIPAAPRQRDLHSR